jgi:hypothetical protein
MGYSYIHDMKQVMEKVNHQRTRPVGENREIFVPLVPLMTMGGCGLDRLKKVGMPKAEGREGRGEKYSPLPNQNSPPATVGKAISQYFPGGLLYK